MSSKNIVAGHCRSHLRANHVYSNHRVYVLIAPRSAWWSARTCRTLVVANCLPQQGGGCITHTACTDNDLPQPSFLKTAVDSCISRAYLRGISSYRKRVLLLAASWSFLSDTCSWQGRGFSTLVAEPVVASRLLWVLSCPFLSRRRCA